MIIKSNPVTEEVSAVDRHQLYNLITPYRGEIDPFSNTLDVHQGVGYPSLSFYGSKELLQVPPVHPCCVFV